MFSRIHNDLMQNLPGAEFIDFDDAFKNFLASEVHSNEHREFEARAVRAATIANRCLAFAQQSCMRMSPAELAAEIGLLARRLGVIHQVLPEMEPLYDCPQDAEWHPEGDVWTHTLMVIDESRRRNDDLDRARLATVMLGAVCHDLGKPATTQFIDGRIRSLDHEEQGVAPASALLDRLNVNAFDGYDVRRQVLGITAQHLKPGSWFKVRDEVGDGAFRRLAHKVDLELLARVAKSDCEGRGGGFDCSAMDWFVGRARELGVEHAAPQPLVLGRHLLQLGMTPGPSIGEVLKEVYERQLDGSVATFEDAFALARRIVGEKQRIY